jgi:hypothetical protein
MNPDDGQIRIRARRDRNFRETGVKNEQQSEQYSANVQKISRKWHALLHGEALSDPRLNSGTVVSRQDPV